MKYRGSLSVLFIVTSALMTTACGLSTVQSRPLTGERPPADLMTTPAEFSPPPVSINPVTGEREMVGADAFPWAIETLDIGGDIRSRLIRLQNWTRTLLSGRTERDD